MIASAASIDDIAKAIVTYFPKVSGKVTAVREDTVVIQSENEAGLSEGVLLSVYQAGDPFYHPVTHAELGHFEKEVDVLEVVKVQQGQITANMIKSNPSVIPAVIPGSLIRVTSARIPIGISGGVTEQDRFIIHELGLALTETGRFSISKQPVYLITLTVDSRLMKVQMKNVKTGKIVSEIDTTLQSENETDSVIESLQHKLFEKQQKSGLPAK